MGFRCGIVGLPNVGKSTLFNALTSTAQAVAANYPFCTIEPNFGQVPVPDNRLDSIARIAGAKRKIPTFLNFVDIAGLVNGAAKGEGLGNQFLANIREVDAILHVVRCFEDEHVSHVNGRVDPIRDTETVETELILADLESLGRRISSMEKRVKSDDKKSLRMISLMKRVEDSLNTGLPARSLEMTEDESLLFPSLELLSAKPVVYISNVNEEAASKGNHYSKQIEDFAQRSACQSILISAAIEYEMSQLDNAEEIDEFLQALNLDETGLSQVIRVGYSLLGLITFFTAGPKEAKAWTVSSGVTAGEASGVIHTDFQRGFIRAETIAYEDYTKYNGEIGAKDAGKMRSEGREYQVQDGDILLFRFNI